MALVGMRDSAGVYPQMRMKNTLRRAKTGKVFFNVYYIK